MGKLEDGKKLIVSDFVGRKWKFDCLECVDVIGKYEDNDQKANNEKAKKGSEVIFNEIKKIIKKFPKYKDLYEEDTQKYADLLFKDFKADTKEGMEPIYYANRISIVLIFLQMDTIHRQMKFYLNLQSYQDVFNSKELFNVTLDRISYLMQDIARLTQKYYHDETFERPKAYAIKLAPQAISVVCEKGGNWKYCDNDVKLYDSIEEYKKRRKVFDFMDQYINQVTKVLALLKTNNYEQIDKEISKLDALMSVKSLKTADIFGYNDDVADAEIKKNYWWLQ